MDEIYLGDGLYASIDKMGQIILRAPREDGDHWIAMDQPTFDSFIEWLERAMDADITITEKEPTNDNDT